MVSLNGTQKISALEGLKGILAVIIALFVHYNHFYSQNGVPGYMNWFPFTMTWGWLCVELFFMISGFGIYLGYSSRIIDGMPFKEYIFKRVVKIYPMYFTSLVVTTVLQYFYMTITGEPLCYRNFDVYHVFLQVFLLQGGLLENDWSYFGTSWFISVILLCYMLFWHVRKSSDDRFVRKQLVILFIALALLTCGINYPILNSLIFRGIACFVIGTLLAWIYKSKKANNRLISGVFTVILLSVYLIYRHGGAECIGNIQLFFIMFAGPMMLWVCLYNPIINKVLSCRPLVYLGTISLGIYLWHFPIQCAIKISDIFFQINIKYESELVSFIYLFIYCYCRGDYLQNLSGAI